MPFSDPTRLQIDTYLSKVLDRYVTEALTAKTEKPFHERLMPALAEVPFSERSFSTRTGSWFQKIAVIVAKQYHAEAVSNYLVSGDIQPAAEAHIRAILEQMDHGSPRRVPHRARDISEVLSVQSPGGTKRDIRSDLFVLRHDRSEMYFELKTPGPNKGQCKGMKQDILLITALRHQGKAEAFASAAYNPYGEGNPYRAQYVPQFLEIGQDFLVGRDFWSKIGDSTTYDELLEISAKVGQQARIRLQKSEQP